MSAPKTDDQRHFTRIPFESPVHVVSAQGTWDTQLIDISLNGVLVKEPASWNANPGDHFLLQINLYNSDIEIRMEVEVSHIEGGHIGFHCKHIDLDSITHLRRLVELNVGDTNILNRELSALGS